MQVSGAYAGDKEWLLLVAKAWREGGRPYVDFFEVNPPLVIGIYAGAGWISAHLPPLRDYQALGLMGLALSALSAWLCLRIMRLHPAFRDNARARRGFTLLLLSVFILFTGPAYFFDRDHIFFLLAFPYLLRFMPSLSHAKISLRLRLLIALLAGVGFCIKPYTAIVFAIVQLMILWRKRAFAAVLNLETQIVVASAALYGVCVWCFAPEYLHVILPMAMATYSGFNRRVNGYLFITVALISAGLTFSDFRPRHKTPYRADAYYFIGICIAFLIYALAGNGWGYTYNPLLCTLLFVSGWMLLEYQWLARDAQMRGLPPAPFLFGVRACWANLGINAFYIMLCIGQFFFGSACSGDACKPDPFYQYIKEHHIHSFSTMSMNLRRWTAIVRQTHTQWGSRFNSLWMLPQLMIGGPEFVAKHHWIVDYMSSAYATDLERYKPEIVFVENGEAIFDYPHPVDMPGLLSYNPEFQRAWSAYHRVDTIDKCEDPNKKSEPSKPAEGPPAKQIHIDCRFDIYARGR